MAADKVWTHVRLKTETAERIRREAAQLVQFYLEHPDRQPEGFEIRENVNPGFVGMSMDDMVNLLLDARQGRRERANRSKRARRKVQTPPAGGEGEGK